MIPSMTLAEENDPDPWGRASEIRQGALSEAQGDTMRAFFLLSLKTRDLLDGANVLQRDLELCERANDRYEEYLGMDNRSWLEKAWKSDVADVIKFLAGVWLGTRIVYSVN